MNKVPYFSTSLYQSGVQEATQKIRHWLDSWFQYRLCEETGEYRIKQLKETYIALSHEYHEMFEMFAVLSGNKHD